MEPAAVAGRVGIVLAALVSLVALARLGRPREALATIRRRLLFGLPWATLTVSALVVAVYLFVQGGWSHWRRPLVVAFRSWTYLYPLGMLAAAFAHAGPGHLLGNVAGTLALGSLAEYAVGHFPRERGATTFASWRTNPYVRALVVLPGAVVAGGVALSAVAVGPVVGFSGVVYALGGFAVAYYPIRTVVALTVSDGLRLAYRALRSPVVVAGGRATYVTPWWANVAVQGHAVGFVVGVAAAVVLQRRRGDAGPTGGRLWVGATLFVVAQTLWAVYWYRGGSTFVLYRGVGLAAALLLAVLVAVAVGAAERPLWPSVWDDLDVDAGADAATDGGYPDRARRWLARRWPPTRARVAFLALVVVVAGVAGPAVPLNLVTTGDDDLPNESLSVRDYEVTYAEGVENGMVSVVEGGPLDGATSVNTSGVIVRSSDRHVWTTAASKGRLAFAGTLRVVVGGVGWRRTVVATRQGWSAVGGPAAYRVQLSVGDRSVTPFRSAPAQADPRPAGRNVSVAAGPGGFLLEVETANGSVQAPLPAKNESLTLSNVTFVRHDDSVVAVTTDGTRVTVFERESYGGNGG
ncbi:MAG: rhomboid family intramembrane serine protease [Halolamina sp.]